MSSGFTRAVEHTRRILADYAPQLRASASPASFASMTTRLKSHRPRASDGQRELIAAAVKRDGGFGTLLVHGEIRDERSAAQIVAGDVTGGDLVAKLDAVREAGAKALLVDLRSNGGLVTEGLAVARAMRRFSAECGPVIGFVSKAQSMGAWLAVSADYCVADPWGEWLVHWTHGGTAEARAVTNEAMVEWFLERTLIDRETLEPWLGCELHLTSHDAVSYGFADTLGSRDDARELAAKCARLGVLTYDRSGDRGFRQQVLAQRRAERT